MANLESIIGSQDTESKDSDIDSADLDVQKELLRLKRFHSDTMDRQWLAVWTAVVVSFWLLLVMILLYNNTSYIFLSDAVLMTLLGTTTLNVLGLSFIVLRGHFNASHDSF